MSGYFRSITYNNKNSVTDFDLYVAEAQISPPKKREIKETIPYMSGSYDFSLLYGEDIYEERDIKYIFDIVSYDNIKLNNLKDSISDWLLSSNTLLLVDSNIIGYAFKAKFISIDYNDDYDYSKMTITGKAYPFKIKNCYEGNNLWDTFDFTKDVFQKTSFDLLDNNYLISLYNNSSIKIVPVLQVYGKIRLVMNNKIYEISTGTYKDDRFKLNKGVNIINISGAGSVKFLWRNEVL